MKKLLYFAYGSNLLSARLKARIGSAVHFKNYRLKDYKLTFDCQGYANIQKSIGDHVEGCLYSVSGEELAILNQYEALYHAEFFEYDSDTIIAIYIGNYEPVKHSKVHNLAPMRAYLEIVMLGMLEKGLKLSHDKVKRIYDSLPLERVNIKSNRKAKRFRKRK